ncbi:hypothetical protein F5Y17DRAFT_156390 [Xylariaceae sp. FL0594]|nr:hypothetical protein F5Y17DRAFT_156390 [Xylariaceae sp. FL0594]
MSDNCQTFRAANVDVISPAPVPTRTSAVNPSLLQDQADMISIRFLLANDVPDPTPAFPSDFQPHADVQGYGFMGDEKLVQNSRAYSHRMAQYSPPLGVERTTGIQGMRDSANTHVIAPTAAPINSPTKEDDSSGTLSLPSTLPTGQRNYPEPNTSPERFVPRTEGLPGIGPVSSPRRITSSNGYGNGSGQPGSLQMPRNVPTSITDHTMTATYSRPPVVVSPPQSWESFLDEEKIFISNCLLDKFANGSRLYVGNLSPDKASKEQLFNIFSKHGRLAQIYLKPSYGFVQYYTADGAQAAFKNLQGAVVNDQRLNLEISRPRKRDNDGQRCNRPERGSDRQNGGRQHRQPSPARDYRKQETSHGINDRDRPLQQYDPCRQPSPARDYREPETSHNINDRDRPFQQYDPCRSAQDGYYHSSRRRSRSPRFDRRSTSSERRSPGYDARNLYRHRSPGPRYHYPGSADPDLAHRTGRDVADVHLLVLEDVRPNYVADVVRAFELSYLTVSFASLHLRDPLPGYVAVCCYARQGMHAIAQLDYKAEQKGKIQLLMLDHSAGPGDVRLQETHDLCPDTAAQLLKGTPLQFQVSRPAHGYPPSPLAEYLPPPTKDPALSQHPSSYSDAQRSLGRLDDFRIVSKPSIISAGATTGVRHGLCPRHITW